MDFPELNRPDRGHDFYPPNRASIPGLYETEEHPLRSKVIHEHYFVRGGSGDWWVAEIDHNGSGTSMLAFGYADLGFGEWGNFDLVDLESLHVARPGSPPLIVERDLHWTPRPWSEVRR